MSAVEEYLGMRARDAVDRVLTRARSYVEHETPSGAAEEIAALGRLIAAQLETAGATVDIRDAPVLVLAHIDTVHPIGTLAERPFRTEDGRAYGPGIYDMKTGLALVIEALAWLGERGRTPRRPLELLVTCDEEIGSHTSRAAIEQAARRAAAVLVPEPCLPDGGVKTFRKGVATYQVEARGIAAHAGIDGTQAVSATAELVQALIAILPLADHGRGTTINIGTIVGGTASNVVAAHASATVDVRIAEPPERERIDAALKRIAACNPLADLQIRLTEERPPLVRTSGVAALYTRARELAAELGIELSEGGTGGGSDGSLASAAGAATLDGLGARGGGAHSSDEHIVLDDLPFRLALMARLLEEL